LGGLARFAGRALRARPRVRKGPFVTLTVRKGPFITPNVRKGPFITLKVSKGSFVASRVMKGSFIRIVALARFAGRAQRPAHR
jgi:hypothetical protein